MFLHNLDQVFTKCILLNMGAFTESNQVGTKYIDLFVPQKFKVKLAP